MVPAIKELKMAWRENKSARLTCMWVYVNILERERLNCDHKSEYGHLYTKWNNNKIKKSYIFNTSQCIKYFHIHHFMLSLQ